MRVRISVYCGSPGGWGCGALVGTWYDSIEEKYSFYCTGCDQNLCPHDSGKYAWYLTTEVINDEDVDA